MSEPVKPCPFCGEEPGIFDSRPDGQGIDVVVCMTPHCPLMRHALVPEDWNHRAPDAQRERLTEDWPVEVLDMIRQRLEQLGLDMRGCPPMNYDDAISSLATRLGKHAGLKTWAELKAVVEAGMPDGEPLTAPTPGQEPKG